ncbi:hypothetical protein ACFJGX_03545 [Hydrogenophaga sp. UC242_50]|uniref:hypothetical protein n=1 Tax=Hydrogenophaga sp. UC242_50 TaxID=3350169 RepID=UPI0036D313AF
MNPLAGFLRVSVDGLAQGGHTHAAQGLKRLHKALVRACRDLWMERPHFLQFGGARDLLRPQELGRPEGIARGVAPFQLVELGLDRLDVLGAGGLVGPRQRGAVKIEPVRVQRVAQPRCRRRHAVLLGELLQAKERLQMGDAAGCVGRGFRALPGGVQLRLEAGQGGLALARVAALERLLQGPRGAVQRGLVRGVRRRQRQLPKRGGGQVQRGEGAAQATLEQVPDERAFIVQAVALKTEHTTAFAGTDRPGVQFLPRQLSGHRQRVLDVRVLHGAARRFAAQAELAQGREAAEGLGKAATRGVGMQ